MRSSWSALPLPGEMGLLHCPGLSPGRGEQGGGVPPGGRRGQEIGAGPGPGRGPSWTAAPGSRAARSARPVHADRDQVVPAGQRPRPARPPARRTSPGRSGSDHVGARPARPGRSWSGCDGDTPRCRSRGSASLIRSAATGRPPSTAAALTASPQATPENPHRVPVPRLPGPWVTTITSAPSTCRAASSPGVHGDRLQIAAERLSGADRAAPASPASRSPAAVRENQAGSAPPSSITYAAGDGAAGPQPGQHRGQRRVQVRDHHRYPAEVVRGAQHLVVRANPARPRRARWPAAACSVP